MATSRPAGAAFGSEEPTATDGAALPKDEPVSAPPEADVVAGRVLMIAALAERARLESTRDASRFQKLSQWVEHHGLFGNLGEAGAELFDAELGSWSDEDVDTVGWAAEELQVLLWALGREDFLRLEERPDGDALVKPLPLLADAHAFLDAAKLRPLDEVEAKLALYEALLEAVRAEVYARSILEDPGALQLDEEFEELLETITARGFDRKAAAQAGPAGEAVQGLRYWTRTLLSELFADGSPHPADKLDSAKLVSLEDAALAMVLGGAQARVEALAWLVEGDEEVDSPPPE